MERFIRTLEKVLLAWAVALVVIAAPVWANTKSVNVVIIGGNGSLSANSCSYYAANNAGWSGGGCLFLSGPANEFSPLGDFSMFNFSGLTPANVSAANLASFDTAVLMMASTGLACSSNNLSAQAKTDLVSFVGSGKKLIIYDPECVPGPNYSWLPFPFQTSNPGATGSFSGTLTVVEQNTLSKSAPTTDPYYVDTAYLTSHTDAVGDMNVMTTYDPNWSLDMSGTNVNHVTGPVHTYAKYPAGTDKGLIIYNGMDLDYLSYSTSGFYLKKIFFLELLQPFNPSSLGGTVPVVGIVLSPATAYNPPGRPHTVTATLTDLLGNPKSGVAVTFTITGANADVVPACSPAGCMTDASGHVSITYTSIVEGTDQIKGCFNNAGTVVCSSSVTKIWTTKCDVDSNQAINSLDIAAILAARNTLASGPSDPRDADNDGRITIMDSRACVLRCDKPNCAQ